MTRPALSACVLFWQREWEVAEVERLAQAHAEAHAELAKAEARRVDKEAEAARRELAAERAARDAELLMFARKQEEEREKRVEHLQQMAARRIMQQALNRGWLAWFDQYLEVKRERQLLRAAGARLTKPALSACLLMWQHEWEVAEHERLLEAHAELAKAEARRVDKEAEAARQELVAERAARDAELLMFARKQEEEREKRVEHLQGVAARRITQAALSRGWSTWIDQYFEAKRERQLLRAAGARLTRPALSACLSMWQREWEVAEQEKDRKAQEVMWLHEGGELRVDLEKTKLQLKASQAEVVYVAAAAHDAGARQLEALRKARNSQATTAHPSHAPTTRPCAAAPPSAALPATATNRLIRL